MALGKGVVADKVSTIRQLTKKAIEHQAKQFFIFVHLKKGYNSVITRSPVAGTEKTGCASHTN